MPRKSAQRSHRLHRVHRSYDLPPLPLGFPSFATRVTGVRPQLVHRGAILRPTGRLAMGEAVCDVEYVEEGAGDASKVLDLSELHEGEGLLGVGEAYL